MSWALESHDLLRFLLSVVCKWPIINVTLLTLNIATQNTRLMGYFLIVLMKLFELYMFELDLNTYLRHMWSLFLLVRVTYVTFFYEIAYYDYRLHIRINHVPQPLTCDKDLYSNDECPFLPIKTTYYL